MYDMLRANIGSAAYSLAYGRVCVPAVPAYRALHYCMESYAPYVVDLIFYITRACVYGHARVVSLSYTHSYGNESCESIVVSMGVSKHGIILSRAVPCVCMHSRAHV